MNNSMIRRQTAVSIGKFECLHKGHQKLIGKILAQEKKGLCSTVVTIEQENLPQVFTRAERMRMLARMGVSNHVLLFLDAIRTMEPEQFVKEILVDRLHAGYVTCGMDFHFGHCCRGNAAMLETLGKTHGFTVEPTEKEIEDGREISSTWVKEALSAGDMQKVSRLLGSPYFIEGTVCRGRRLGHTLGMPTANIQVPANKLVPPCGVYLGTTEVDGTSYQSITNIGHKPSVQSADAPVSAETYLYAFDGDLYEKELRVELAQFVREERRFESIAALKAQMQEDIARGRFYM